MKKACLGISAECWSFVISRFLLALATLVGLAALTLVSLPPADTWWHLAAGRYILNSGLPATDPFSFTAGDHSWTNHEWLVTVLFYQLYDWGGLGLLYAFRSGLVVISFGVLPLAWAWGHQAEGTWWPLLAPLVWACQAGFFVDVRAYLLTYLFCSWMFFVVLSYGRDSRPGWLVSALVVMVVWANSHGAFVLGSIVLGGGAIGRFLVGQPELGKKLLATSIGGYLLTALNPYGPRIWLFPFSLLGEDAFRLGLNEWATPELWGAQTSYLIVVLVVAALLVWRRPAEPELFLLTLFFCAAGLKTWRHEPLAALCLAYVLPSLLPTLKKEAWRRLAGVVSVVLALALLVPRLSLGVAGMNRETTFFPAFAVQFLKANPDLPKRLYNPYEWGGYLLFQVGPERQVFFDGRAHTVYPEQVYIDGLYLQFGEPWARLVIENGFSPPGGSLEELLERYRVEMVLATKLQGNLATQMANLDDWFLVYEDDNCLAYLPDTPAYRSQKLVYPDTPFSLRRRALENRGTPAELEALLKLTRLAPHQAQGHVLLGACLLDRGHLDQALPAFLKAQQLDPNMPLLHYYLGLTLLRLGRDSEAHAALEEQLKLTPGHQPTLQLLRR